MNGIVNIDKPSEWTSQDVLRKLKNIFRNNEINDKIGHTGTLDPVATGLLTVCIGKATRLIEYMSADLKTYTCTMKLGKTSDTLDITGQIIAEKDYSHITCSQIEKAFKAYRGIIEQVPPKYSALKYKGKPLYEYARKGINIDTSMKKRKVLIKDIEIINQNMHNGEISFKVTCSKGTYVRTICDDIGKTLGCGAIMKELRRVSSGIFLIEDALSIDDITHLDVDRLKKIILPPDKALVNLGEIQIGSYELDKFINGRSIDGDKYVIKKRPQNNLPFSLGYNSNTYKVYNDSKFLGIGEIDIQDSLKVRKVIIDDESV